MELINTTIKSDNRIEREDEWVYQSKDNLGLKNYQEIKNKFYCYPHININQLCDLRCKVNVNLDHIIVFKNKLKLSLFSNTLIIHNMEEEYIEIQPIINEKWREDTTNKTIEEYNGEFIIKIVVNILYYKRVALWDCKLDHLGFCKMKRINKIITGDNDMMRTEKGIYQIFYNENEIKSYDDIKNYFKNFKLDEVYESELKEDVYENITYFKFFLHAKEDIFLFLIKLEVFLNRDLIYETIYPSTDTQDELRELVNQYDGKYQIIIKYETDFYKTIRSEYEFDEEYEEDDDTPPIIETGFASDNCIICCVGKPNILNFPCLHISHCESCEEKGRFINCSICRKEIQRKVKI